MTYTEKKFEEYLETVCFEANPSVLDDDMPDFFDNWLGNQDVEDMIRHCNNFLPTSISQATAEDRERVREVIKEKSRKYKKRIEHFNVPDIGRERAKIVYERNLVLSGKQSACDDLLSSLDKPLTDNKE